MYRIWMVQLKGKMPLLHDIFTLNEISKPSLPDP